MAYPIYIVLTVEGTTDTRFLGAMLEPVFQEMALRYVKDDVDCLLTAQGCYDKSEGFKNAVINASREALVNFGATTLAVHTDSDTMTYEERKATNFAGLIETVKDLSTDEYCTVITPIIPVKMIEAWMLADRELLREELGTTMTNAQLDIDGNPESFANPKQKIMEAIKRASENATHKNPVKNIDISDLYQILGKKLSIEQLERMDSFKKFEQEILSTFKKIGLRMNLV